MESDYTDAEGNVMGGAVVRARITADPTSGVVTLRYYDTVAREVRTRQFVVPADGGYVLELLAKGDCRPGYLTQGGAPLIAESSAELADVIRREYRRMRAAERRLVSKRNQGSAGEGERQ